MAESLSPPAPSPACAARRAVHRHRAHRAMLPAAPARWLWDRAPRLLPAPTPAIHDASRLPVRGALLAEHHPGMHTDSHLEFRVRIAMARECPPPGNEFVPARFHATLRLGLRYPAPR